ncbi:MAG: lysozyme inhibitor LprI family protein [Candidatus Gastranaerophilaceae bacterium]|nr:lysozyme inhibitor LprI family protein [Candidatus Gastranaerophilaceae bacterium]
MKKSVIVFIITVVALLTLVVGEGFYIVKCRTGISKSQNEISDLQTLNNNLRSEILELKSSELNLENENISLKDIQGENHPINIRQQECMKKQNYTTAAMADCTYTALDEWSKEIDTQIVLLKQYMTPQQYKLLVDSQNKWKEYEKAERKLLVETIGTFVGTMYIPTLAGMQEAIVEQRARDLSSLYYYMSDKDIMKN